MKTRSSVLERRMVRVHERSQPNIPVLRGLGRAYRGGLREYDEGLRRRDALISALEHNPERQQVPSDDGHSMPYWLLG